VPTTKRPRLTREGNTPTLEAAGGHAKVSPSVKLRPVNARSAADSAAWSSVLMLLASEVMGLVDRLGYRYADPNAFQRGVQAFAGSRMGAWMTPRTLVPLDRLVSRWSRGRISLPVMLAGLPVVALTTTGRKTGLPRVTHLIAIPFEDTLALLGTNFGQPTTPAWTLNLKADPAATISHAGTTVTVRARSATPDERTTILTTAASKFAGAANYEQRLSNKRPVDIFVLE
jgi:deazaflavin-dependent oxidoreductase (nitroreductase family)